MPKQAEVTYLFNSGFVVELKDKILIFDYYKDKKNQVPEILNKGKKTYMFSSHSHYDHFDQEIFSFQDQVEHYFLSFDIKKVLKKNLIEKDKVTFLNAYDVYSDEQIKVTSFSSTDEGVSFLIELDGWKVFHAGDFNWWHWKGDTEENIKFAKNGFMKQMKKLDGLKADIAFFPVDCRMEEFCAVGAKEFCQRTEIQNLITMHNTQHKPWIVPQDFLPKDKMVSIWVPEGPGENIKIIK